MQVVVVWWCGSRFYGVIAHRPASTSQLLVLVDSSGDGPRRAPAAVVVVGRGGGAPLRAQLLVEAPDELVRLPVHLRVLAAAARRRRRGDDAPHGGATGERPQQPRRGRRGVGRWRRHRRLVILVVVEHLEHPGHVRRVVVVVVAQVPAVVALAEAGGGGGVAAAELDLAAGARRGLVHPEARVQREARELPRGAVVGAGVAVVVGGEEVAEGLAGELAAAEEEVEVHGELAPGRHAPPQHVQHGAQHAPHPARHARLRALLLRHLSLCFFSYYSTTAELLIAARLVVIDGMEWKWLRRVATYLKAGEKDTSRKAGNDTDE
jgi:hypothetical protein